MSAKYYFAVLISVFAFCACESSSNVYDSTDQFGCTRDEQCVSGRCLANGECAKLMRIGESCNSWSAVCMEGLKCESDKCVWEDGAVDRCLADRDCGEKQICYEEGCVRTDGVCRHDVDCVFRKSESVCMPNGKCGHYLDVGEACGEETYCKAGYECRDVCVELLEEGFSCTDNDPLHVCNSNLGLKCFDGVCHKLENGLGRGLPCNDTFLSCDTGLTCKDGLCVQLMEESEACGESDHRICSEGMACLNGACRIKGKKCEESDVCDAGDSYCCQDETCGAPGYCIQFGQVEPYRESCRFEPNLGPSRIQCQWRAENGNSGVEMPPLVGHFGNQSGLDRVIALYSYQTDSNNAGETKIYFIDPNHCKTLHQLAVPVAGRWYHYPAAADLDGDGIWELVAIGTSQTSQVLKIYHWNEEKNVYEEWRETQLDFRASPMIFDIDGDGNPEIVSPFGHVVRIAKDGENGNIKEDLEILYDKDLYEDINDGTEEFSQKAGSTAAIGFLLSEDYPEVAQLVTGEGLYTWQIDNGWKKLVDFDNEHAGQPTWARQFPAYADFGTPGESPESFDFSSYDGKPEIVISGKNHLRIYSVVKTGSNEDGSPMYSAQMVMHVDGITAGGPVSIADFDGDGFPEIAMASQGRIGVYDPECTDYIEGECSDSHVRWERQSEGGATAGAVAFDFDADGRAEVIYADDCTTRIYHGKNGKVLSSTRRTALTSIDTPTVADVDGDGTVEILVGSSDNPACYGDSLADGGVDPIDEGIACQVDADCPTGKCHEEMKLCTCDDDDACNSWGDKGVKYRCVEPIHPSSGMYIHGEEGRVISYPLGTRPESYDYKVCRAVQKLSKDASAEASSHLTLIESRDGHWANGRGIWNQHAYHALHIQDDGRVTSRESWLKSFKETAPMTLSNGEEMTVPVYNHYRMNTSRAEEKGQLLDMTAALSSDDVCRYENDTQFILHGRLCNRGTRGADPLIPVSFYIADKPEESEYLPGQPEESVLVADFKFICSTIANENIPVGECISLDCHFDKTKVDNLNGKLVKMVANIDENGQSLRYECDDHNNAAIAEIVKCEQVESNSDIP